MDAFFKGLGLFCTFIGLLVLCVLLVDIIIDSLPRSGGIFLISLHENLKQEFFGVGTI
jgi:hypothetical protein